jgi:hypothetical protein
MLYDLPKLHESRPKEFLKTKEIIGWIEKNPTKGQRAIKKYTQKLNPEHLISRRQQE